MYCVPFVHSPRMRDLAWTARTFGQRPSALLAIADPMLALELDLAAAQTLALDLQTAREDNGEEEHLYF